MSAPPHSHILPLKILARDPSPREAALLDLGRRVSWLNMFTEQLSDFSAPWCQELLNSPNLIDITTPTRRPEAAAGDMITNSLFAVTLRTETTVRAWKSLRTRQIEGSNLSPTFLLLLSLGSGLGGYKNKLHGGILGAIMDQSHLMCAINAASSPNVTAQLNVRYKNSVPLPSVILCRSVMTKQNGRKIWIQGTVEDGFGTVFCDSEALVVITKEQSKL